MIAFRMSDINRNIISQLFILLLFSCLGESQFKSSFRKWTSKSVRNFHVATPHLNDAISVTPEATVLTTDMETTISLETEQPTTNVSVQEMEKIHECLNRYIAGSQAQWDLIRTRRDENSDGTYTCRDDFDSKESNCKSLKKWIDNHRGNFSAELVRGNESVPCSQIQPSPFAILGSSVFNQDQSTPTISSSAVTPEINFTDTTTSADLSNQTVITVADISNFTTPEFLTEQSVNSSANTNEENVTELSSETTPGMDFTDTTTPESHINQTVSSSINANDANVTEQAKTGYEVTEPSGTSTKMPLFFTCALLISISLIFAIGVL
ncbi:hypothetical protein DdX_10157 [Ditylenchus destructor]|uniref:Uncharacterized protein n=1 Tax=Ditylenchus destructor TaxID=166010 RepID=A0AAD4N3K6_9BILA|nr:hypothetical protein DdX_10157 [Ditylenchus destructor]